nr:hypothetical protein BaRGS_032958 [Batillaria attramentaria]
MAGQGLPIAIPVGKLEEYFQCSICLNTMQQVVVTSCGHRYCDKLLNEKIQELEGQIQEKKESLTAEMQNCQQLVAEAYDRLTVIQTAVEEGLKQRGDEVIRWHPDGGKVLIVRPFCCRSCAEPPANLGLLLLPKEEDLLLEI